MSADAFSQVATLPELLVAASSSLFQPIRDDIEHYRDGDVQALCAFLFVRIVSRLRDVHDGVSEQKGVEHEIEERNHVNVKRVIANSLAEQRQQPADLGIDAEQTESGVDEHPFDFIASEDGQVKDRVNQDGKTSMHIQKRQGSMVVAIRHEKAGTAEDEHVK